VDAKRERPNPEDTGYWRAIEHRADFIGLTEDEATALAARLDLTLELIPAGGWHMGVNVSGRVTLFVRDGMVIAATT
jgi:hypothetical protein